MNRETLIDAALNAMNAVPRNLHEEITRAADSAEENFPEPSKWIEEQLVGDDINSGTLRVLGLAIRKWDSAEFAKWTKTTAPFSQLRRQLICTKLALTKNLEDVISLKIPALQDVDRPIIVAEQKTDWFPSRQLKSNFYWNAYGRYLQTAKNWNADALAKLDLSTDEVVRRLADPCQPQAYSSRGLVVGYVQSGKTANFTGVLAKAADAGYRLIIILAGTLDILRSQTQRRLDKELLGKEQVGDDYISDADWDEFLSFGALPSCMGAVNWERLTGPLTEYKELDKAIAALQFKSVISGRLYNDPENLKQSPVRILVIKKIPKVLQRLAKDFAKIKKSLDHVPMLIIDDESDQASINTFAPATPKNPIEKGRTSTNKLILELLNSCVRGQYLGYTATPFANVFVDPGDAEDLFPKDFIISLPRPAGYMGVLDFYDMDDEPAGFRSNNRAFIRDVEGDDCGGFDEKGKATPNHLQIAVDSFVLAGAIKLFREALSPGVFKYKHHTMLVHHSITKADHVRLAADVQNTYDLAGYHGGEGIRRMEKLFDTDFLPVSQAKEPGFPMPENFSHLKPFIGSCIDKLDQGKTILIVNGDNKDDTPDFDKNQVWAVLVGGTKLSRGYTVEGLTITYFRRVSSTTDTLMQMGRWFGYRPGYGDLVRLFIGRAEPFGNKGKTKLDLYEAFKAICQDEEKFRQDIKKYQDGTLTPKQIPPLVPSHLRSMKPTAKNKMYNHKIVFENFGGDWSSPTVVSNKKADAAFNLQLGATLIGSCPVFEYQFEGTLAGPSNTTSACKVNAYCAVAKNTSVTDFLNNFCWAEAKKTMFRECEFIEDKIEKINPVDDWLLIIPKLQKSTGDTWNISDEMCVPVHERSRAGSRFKAFTTPDHVAVAEYIALENAKFVTSDALPEKLISKKRGVMLIYPVRAPSDLFTSLGFALVFPKNNAAKKIVYSVVDKSNPNQVVVDAM